MNKANDGGPAFLTHAAFGNSPGLSIRDWFAGQALVGYLAAHTGDQRFPEKAWVVEKCYGFADAMLAERDRPADQK